MGKSDVSDASDEAKQRQNFLMNTEANRLASFQDWPFDEDCNCVPSKMAAAGFYHCPTQQEPDLVRCFMCSKELDGWEPTDDPLEEHKSHAPKCAFITKKKDEKDMTMAEFFKLESVRQHNRVMTHVENRIKEFTYEAEKTRQQIEGLKNQ
ncbi:baculoviral IAP repeat-containing protein 5-like isoform X4 [Patiria miniata]|uniref:Survivin n=1 Tax=Patiria miniata TaxID=46514 RepID=A0A914AUF0_PATMI|nr:baculoviral IAP repeat-containing protein 5-like isoform X1 [Patiria miniata]XP_038067137.1 baculoviral IAP repeat-containing protein 5-like isoform X2 [Patiria miniata]XP_038067138.1 baculoviral IAP repeat-containing protein 5-like isoform X3 [Patiria miniata]XP_038067139.1 baculoviral IAP repeat-containing protein 5-like isoform X4 [Patiria miniata]